MLDFLLITILIMVVAHWLQSKPFMWKSAGIPYSVPWPIFGATAKTFVKPLYEVWDELYWKMGDSKIYGFHLFGKPSLIVGDPTLVKRFTTSDSEYFMSHGFHTDPSYDPMSKGLFFVDGEEWRTIRSKMTPYFTPSRIKGMLPLVHPIAESFVKNILDLGRVGPVNVYESSMKLSVDTVVCTVFGVQSDSFTNANSFFFGLQRELISFTTGIKFMVGEISPALYGFLGLSVFTRNTTNKLTQFTKDVTQQRLNGIGNRPDFIQGMVDLMQKERSQTRNEMKLNNDGTPFAKFDDFTVTGQCMLMYIAGTETTGSTLTFLLYELALNQEIQDKARKEIKTMIEKNNGEYGFEELHDLKYVKMVLNETLRKYPIVTSYSRKCTREITIDGIQIPVGTMVMIVPYSLHRDPRYFSEPEKFIPERFSDESSIIPGSYVPFGMGPRTCLGLKFAETEIILALCKLLPKVKFTTSKLTQRPLKFSPNPTLSPLNGIMLDVEEIN